MFKNNKKRFLSAVLLILTVTLLLGIAAIPAFSASAGTKQLKVELESDAHCAVILTVNNEEQSTFTSSFEKAIPYPNEGVSVTVKPNAGYDIDAIYEIKDGVATKLDIATANRKWSAEYFNRDVTLRITCKPKTYKIEFLPEANETELSYEFFQSSMPTSYTYKGEPVTIGPVRKNSGVKDAEGYFFKGWEVVHKEADGSIKKIGSWSLDSDQNCEIGSDITVFDEWQESGVIYLRPSFEPKNYPVWRYDYVITNPDNLENPGWKLWLNEKNPTMWEAPMASEITGDWAEGESSPYLGYDFLGYTTHRVTVDENNEQKNVVYRYFKPISYKIQYQYANGELVAPEGGSIAELHVYNESTLLPSATRKGYTFKGWIVLVNGVEVERINAPDAMYLTECIEAYAKNNLYNTLTLVAEWTPIPYDIEYDLGGADPLENPSLPKGGDYGNALLIPTPVRKGYQFLGWVVNGDDSKIIPALTLEAETYLDTVHLRAVWQAKVFEVVLDSNGGGPNAETLLPGKVTFDAPLNTDGISLPKRSQYKLLGFYYENTLYINADGSSACNQWDLDAASGTDRITLTAKWELLPVTEVDPGAYGIDYKNEKFQFPAGSYKVTLGEITVEFTVEADGMGAKIPEEFFGNTVQLTVCTPDDTLYSDYHGSLVIVARPDAPTRENNIIDQVFSTNTTIEVVFQNGIDPSLYETALYLDGKSVVAWGNTLRFEDLKEGTSYVVLVRVKATDATPCSLSTQFDRDTDSQGFKESLRKELDQLIQPGDGEMVNALIADAKNKLDELKHSPTFYEDAQKIVTDAAAAVKFARRQDQRITDLKSYMETLLKTKAYSQANQALIQSLCADAEAKIITATSDAVVQEAYEAAYRAMSDVKITYLRNDDIFVTSENGLPKDYTVTLVRHPDFTTQAEQTNSAIVAGKVFGFGGNSPENLIKLLKNQDVMAAYTMSLSGTEYTGTFKVTLHLPEELRGVSGLRVAYYDKATGSLEVLETETEGDYLVFYAESIADFVILGDPVLNLIAPMIALFVVAICQLIAIALILKGRSDSKKAVRNYSIATPVLLTVQFLPRNGEWIVLILGALVILLQIVLTVLLLKSEVIHRSRLKRGAYRVSEEALPTMADAEDAYADATAYSAEAAEENAQDEGEDTFYYASVNTENECPEDADTVYPESATYSLDETTGELYEDPAGEYTEELLNSDALSGETSTFFFEENAEEAIPEASVEEPSYAASEDAEAEAPLFLFDDEDVVYGDPAEPPYEDDAVTDEPEETEITDTYQ